MIVSHPILLREEGEYGRKGRPQFTVDELAYRHGACNQSVVFFDQGSMSCLRPPETKVGCVCSNTSMVNILGDHDA